MCKIKHSAAFVRSSTHPRGRIQGRAGFMSPPLQPADAETKTTAGFLAGTPVAHCGSDFGEKQAVRAVPEKLSVHTSPSDEATQARFFARKTSGAYSLSNYRSPQRREDPNTTVSDGNSVYYTRELHRHRIGSEHYPRTAVDAFSTKDARGAGVPQQRPEALNNPSSIPSQAGRHLKLFAQRAAVKVNRYE